jgi:hypothetical protein
MPSSTGAASLLLLALLLLLLWLSMLQQLLLLLWLLSMSSKLSGATASVPVYAYRDRSALQYSVMQLCYCCSSLLWCGWQKWSSSQSIVCAACQRAHYDRQGKSTSCCAAAART